LEQVPIGKAESNIEGLANNITQHPHLRNLNSNSYDSNFDKFQNGNTFKVTDNNFFNALSSNDRPNLEYISNLTDSLTMSKKDVTSNNYTVQIKPVDVKVAESKENLPDFMAYMQKNNGSPVTLTQYSGKMTLTDPSKPGASSLQEIHSQDKIRAILSEKPINTNTTSTNNKGSLDYLDQNSEALKKKYRHEYRIDTQNTNYDASEDESIHDIDATGARFRKKPNLLIKLEERRTTLGSNYA